MKLKTYICDPEKCEKCEKTLCQTLCFRTMKKEQRAVGLSWIKYAARAVLSEIEAKRGAKRWTSKN